MGRAAGSLMAIAALAGVLACSSGAPAQTTAPADNASPTADNAVMLTVFLKHDQSRPLSELNAQLERQGFYKAFPPPGIEVVSWYIMMGIGQAVTLRLPASRLREVNRVLENTAWGIARNSIRPTTTRRSGSRSTKRRNRPPGLASPVPSREGRVEQAPVNPAG